MTGRPALVLPPEAADFYRSGATVRDVALRYGCSHDVARRALERDGVQIRHQRNVHRTPIAGRVPCGDCGEDLNHPHPSGLGTHLPGCSALEHTS